MFYQTQTARKPPKSPPAATEWSRLPVRDVICSDRVTKHLFPVHLAEIRSAVPDIFHAYGG